jgi:phage terminase large subunit-like protein
VWFLLNDVDDVIVLDVPSPQETVIVGVNPPKSVNGKVKTVLAAVVVILTINGNASVLSDVVVNLLNIPITLT